MADNKTNESIDRWRTAFNKLSEPREPDVVIQTPNGEYTTSQSLAQGLNDFLQRTRVRYAGAIGGQFNYIFTSTSLGVILVVEDSKSKETFNVTNFADW